MKTIKNLYISSILSVLCLVGCNDKLEIDPRQSIDALTALQTEADVESGIIGAYSRMGSGSLYGTNLNIIPELLGSDSYVRWAGTFQGYRQLNAKALTANNSEATRTWINTYSAINNVNNVLSNLDKVKDASLKRQFEGEALWIRGMLYFELVRLYSLPYLNGVSNDQLGIPISLTAVFNEAGASVKGKRESVEVVYNQILKDLIKSKDLLNTIAPNNVKKDVRRASVFSPMAVLSRVYLTRAGTANSPNINLDSAQFYADKIITSSKFAILSSLESVFTNKNSRESIFEIEQNEQNNAGQTNDGLTTFYASLVGIGRGDLRVETAFRTSYQANDKRRSELIYVGVGARPNFSYSGKWKTFSQNLPVIRLAEMYLTRGECAFRKGDLLNALSDINVIRRRSSATDYLITDLSLNNFLRERQFELAFEGSRIHDLRRLKRNTGSIVFNAPNLVLPIPEREVRANTELIQNPGYNN